MTQSRLKCRDIEWVERGRRDSSLSRGSDPLSALTQHQANEHYCGAHQNDQKSFVKNYHNYDNILDSRIFTLFRRFMSEHKKESNENEELETIMAKTTSKVINNKAMYKVQDPQDTCHKVFIWKIRFLHMVMAGVLAYVGLQQWRRYDAAVWIPVFLVPSCVTMISAVRIRAMGSAWVRSVVSVYLGSSLCLLLWLVTSLMILVVDQASARQPNYNPLDYQLGREALAVLVCIGWQKFHLHTTREQIRVTYSSLPHQRCPPHGGLSPQAVLRRVVPLLLLPLALAAFCYVDSVRPAVVSTTLAIRRVVRV